MSEEPVSVKVVGEKKKESWYKRIFNKITGRTPETTLQESERFSKLGYIQYPKSQQLDLRIFTLMEILEEIEKDVVEIEKKRIAGEKIGPYAYRNIKRLFRAFMTIGGPWFRGLDNRELAEKAVTFFKIETAVGHLPAFYPDLRLCTETLINLSWQAIDVTAQTPILMETRTQVLPPKERISLDKATVDEI